MSLITLQRKARELNSLPSKQRTHSEDSISNVAIIIFEVSDPLPDHNAPPPLN